MRIGTCTIGSALQIEGTVKAGAEVIEERARLALEENIAGRVGGGAGPHAILAKGPCAAAAVRTWNGCLAILAEDQQSIFFGGKARESLIGDPRRDRLNSGKAIVNRAAKREAGIATGEIRNRLIGTHRRQILLRAKCRGKDDAQGKHRHEKHRRETRCKDRGRAKEFQHRLGNHPRRESGSVGIPESRHHSQAGWGGSSHSARAVSQNMLDAREEPLSRHHVADNRYYSFFPTCQLL